MATSKTSHGLSTELLTDAELQRFRSEDSEDLDFTRRLKRPGRTVVIRVPMRTSGRRFLARGPWRTFFFIVWLLLLYTLWLDTQRCATALPRERFYVSSLPARDADLCQRLVGGQSLCVVVDF